jgi:hypothetical protein
MTKDQKKALARIFRRQAKFMADMPTLTSLIEAAGLCKMLIRAASQ